MLPEVRKAEGSKNNENEQSHLKLQPKQNETYYFEFNFAWIYSNAIESSL